MTTAADPRGSLWRRWDPHIHAPGTALNNQFGANAWEPYLAAIEQSEPRIEALGVTDYYSIDTYEVVIGYKAAGRLPGVGLVFPNIELRLPTATGSDHPVNLHLLVSPEATDHVEQTRRFLRTLKFESNGESYACDREDLIRLGRAHDTSITDDGAALRTGTNQFKVTVGNLKDSFAKSAWAQDNILVAVAGGSNDGTSGVQAAGGSLEATRQEIERFAHVIFAGAPKQREFWLGDGVLSREELASKLDGPKPCLHGSDAHSLAKVGKPDNDRYTWIKGDATFETLRQACLEPRERAVVAIDPPSGALPHRVIKEIAVGGATWFGNGAIPLSPGLVAIIGARGSGKTALADLIAAGAGAASDDASEKTFLQRARPHIGGSSVALTWADGSSATTELPPSVDPDAAAGVQYLSQQFVERLCSAEGMTDELLTEIERVIFEAHGYEDRLGTSSFRELLDIRASHGRNLRAHANQAIASLSDQIEHERSARAQLPAITADQARLTKLLDEDKKARTALVVTGGEARSERLEAVNAELGVRQGAVDIARRREQSLVELEAAIADMTARRLPALAADLQRAHAGAGLSASDWQAFELKFTGDPAHVVAKHLVELREQIADLTGRPIPRPTSPAAEWPPFIADGVGLGTEPLSTLKAESTRLGQLIGLDGAKQKQLTALNDKITKNEAALAAANTAAANATGAQARIKVLAGNRKASYASLFDGFASEQAELTKMYEPLSTMLSSQRGTLGKLSFSVRRVVNVEAWAARGEDLMDLRTGTTFRGRGELLRVATDTLLNAWESGASADVADAMAAFRNDHDQHIIEQAKVPQSNATAFRAWANDVAAWLNSTDHISVSYGIQYDGVDIEQLSPGTRGIVLLLLYLAVDQSDDRPLIIDQPEENLDPKSIFVELVGRFVETRHRRQIIIVTHNANLVVNTDADQVIVASAGAHVPGGLPVLTYLSGGLENPVVRDEVCEILEGGRPAFEERARRLRIRLV
ncbi:TrlF family AAA-like ATPase [Microbacterium sp. NPDC057944]|uniref:TrlF family AAA-like ATPase n=1 Tax=Microbacterium sp. NPDC057944 TaxID=3346286 RepID=UPI0036DDB428